jgi:hypothetical protein
MSAKQKPLAASLLSSMDGWETIPESEQELIETEFVSLYESLRSLTVARLAVGEHLHNIREVLEPKRLFTRFLNSQTTLSKATAYRYIDLYLVMVDRLPAPVLEVVMQRGVDSINIKRLDKTPPPKTTSVVKINEWVDTIQRREPKEERSEIPEEMKRDCYNYVRSRIMRLPSSTMKRAAWLRSLVSMLVADLGVAEMKTIEPVPAPEGFAVIRGRHKKIAA